MDDVNCKSVESRLINCSYSVNENCGHHEDAGVQCVSSSTGKTMIQTDHYYIIIDKQTYSL